MIMSSRYRVIKYTRKSKSGVFEYDMVLDMTRFGKQISKAQYDLDSMVMTHMLPYMPKDTGTFIDVTTAMSATYAGTGKVVAAAPPFGRYLYEGYVMVDSVTGKGPMVIPNGPGESILRFRKGAKLKPTNRKISYYRGANRQATDHWFEAAKAQHAKEWIAHVKKTAGGG